VLASEFLDSGVSRDIIHKCFPCQWQLLLASVFLAVPVSRTGKKYIGFAVAIFERKSVTPRSQDCVDLLQTSHNRRTSSQG
jgi:hypothetical protein